MLKVAGIYGLLAPAFAFALILLAVASHPQFIWANNALSDLGIVSGITASLFNSGLIISGVLFLNFTTGLFFFINENLAGRVGAFILAAACAALISIGMFPENIKPIHYAVSVAFFTLQPIALLVIASAFWRARKNAMALFTLLMALIAAAPWVLQFSIHYVSGVAIPEFVSGLAGAAWVATLGSKMIKEASLTENLA